MASLSELHSKIADAIGGLLTIDEFQDWFLSNNWNAHLFADHETVALVQLVEGNLLDFESNAIGDQTLRMRLASAVPFADNRAAGSPYPVSGSISETNSNAAVTVAA